MPNLYLPVSAMLLSIILLIVFFARKRVTLLENKLYICMLFAILVDSFLVSALFFNAYVSYNDFLVKTFNKIDYCFLIIWASSLFLYAYVISYNKKERFKEKFKLIFTVVCFIDVIMFIIVFLSKVDIIIINELKMTAQGMAVTLSMTFCILYFISAFIITMLNIKYFSKKYLPIFAIIFITVLIAFLFSINPYLICISMGLSLVNLIMYFTIENPDLNLIQELLRNKELVQNSTEDKSKFLFKVSQDIRIPLQDILYYIKEYKEKSNTKQIDETIGLIEKKANDISYMVNDILDISKLDVKNIKVYNTSYDTKKFFEDIKKKTESLLENKDIKFNMLLSNDIPKILYGDSIKLKQVLMGIIDNAIKHTREGFINIDVSALVRFDVCRMIINVADTGSGMSLENINKILSQTSELTKEEENSLNSLDINIKIIKKILSLIGGSLNIKSEEYKGTTISIYIDQRINGNEEKEYAQKMEQYNEQMDKRNRILIVNDDLEEVKLFEKELSKYHVVSNLSLYGNDCINKINANERYSLILIKDTMKNEGAIEILKDLKKIKGFKTKVIVILDKNKSFMKEHYLEDGFSDYIIKENINTELKRISDKYL